MTRTIVLLLGAVALLSVVGMASAHNPHQLALRELAYVPDDKLPVIDGKLSPGEYDWVPAKFVYKLADYLGNTFATSEHPDVGPWVMIQNTSYSAQDFDVPFVFLGWSPKINALVIAVQTIDDVGYFSRSYYETFRGMDLIGWWMDADHDGGQYQYYDPPRTGIDGQQGIFRPDANRGGRPDLPMWGCYGFRELNEEITWAFREPYTKSAITIDEATGSYTVETTMQIWDWLDRGGPGASVPHTLKQGEIIGMGFNILDIDKGSDRIRFMWLSGQTRDDPDPAFDAGMFDDWILLGPKETGVPTAVESSTWGRIKSSFR